MQGNTSDIVRLWHNRRKKTFVLCWNCWAREIVSNVCQGLASVQVGDGQMVGNPYLTALRQSCPPGSFGACCFSCSRRNEFHFSPMSFFARNSFAVDPGQHPSTCLEILGNVPWLLRFYPGLGRRARAQRWLLDGLVFAVRSS